MKKLKDMTAEELWERAAVLLEGPNSRYDENGYCTELFVSEPVSIKLASEIIYLAQLKQDIQDK